MNYSIGRFAPGTDPVFFIKAAIKNDVDFKIKGIGQIHLKKGQFNLVGLPATHSDLTAKKHEAGIFSAYYSLLVLEKYIPFFPGLSHFTEVAKSQPLLMFEKNKLLTKKLASLIDETVHFPEDNIASKPYVENCLKEFIIRTMQQKYTHTAAGYKLTTRYIEALKVAKEIMESNHNNDTTVKHLAFLVGLRQHELKTLYKAVFKTEITHLIGD